MDWLVRASGNRWRLTDGYPRSSPRKTCARSPGSRGKSTHRWLQKMMELGIVTPNRIWMRIAGKPAQLQPQQRNKCHLRQRALDGRKGHSQQRDQGVPSPTILNETKGFLTAILATIEEWKGLTH